MEQITKNQHWVPQFYLRGFSNGDGLLEVFDIEENSFKDAKKPEEICYEEFFYGEKTGMFDRLSQALEKAFNKIEDRFAPKVNSIVERVLNENKICQDEHNFLAIFMATLWVRSKYFREVILQSIDNSLRDLVIDIEETIYTGEDKEQYEENKKEWLDGIKTELDKRTNAAHLNLIAESEDWARIFLTKDIVFFVSTGGSEFITSDTPVTEEYNPSMSRRENTMFHRRYYFPLTPKVLIKLPRVGEVYTKMQVLKVDDNEVQTLNMLKADLSYKHVYSRRKDEIQNLKDIHDWWLNGGHNL